MADTDSADRDTPRTFTQAEVDRLIEERNRALEDKTRELLAETKAAKDAQRKSDTALTELQTRLASIEEEKKASEAGIQSDKLDEIRAAAEANLEKKYGPVRQQLEEAQKMIRTLQLDNVVKSVMGKSGVRGERVDALFRLTADRFDLTDDGKPILKTDPTSPLDQYVADELGKEYPEFFEGSGSSGGGAPKSTVSGGSKVISADDQAAFLGNLEAIAKGEIQVLPTE